MRLLSFVSHNRIKSRIEDTNRIPPLATCAIRATHTRSHVVVVGGGVVVSGRLVVGGGLVLVSERLLVGDELVLVSGRLVVGDVLVAQAYATHSVSRMNALFITCEF